MFPFHKPEPPFSWRGGVVRVRLSLGDSEAYYLGLLKELYNDGLLIQTCDTEIFVPRSTILSIEKVKT